MITLWHNPRCSKSRATLALLQDAGAEVRERRYLDDTPSKDEIRATLAMLGISALSMMRKGEARFKELGLTAETDKETLITAMSQNPILIERPIALNETQAAIGRPPENVLTLLKG